MLADAVGLALFFELDTLPPAERLAFVLQDVFAVPFEQIASIVERSPEAARKLASRARRRIERADVVPDCDIAAQRRLVDAFFAAGRTGDFDRLVSLPDRGVVLRGDLGHGAVRSAHGASAVAALARSYAAPEREVRRDRERRGRRSDLRRRPPRRGHGLPGAQRTHRRDRRAGRSPARRQARSGRAEPLGRVSVRRPAAVPWPSCATASSCPG
ncbi:putative ECF RNA polymerase sigma factor SigI [Mycobacterium kansasii]|nr:putative ECF RNA polymerase sigma factor SigI [Mycobacterium kansasii]VAZ67921.1 putative ECF RNA polymerase sigma factor SigI [Mycobacterium kansasii]VAZ77773.1 putative ECF RNA polymerase sigma factor SigI [Mycobacterium kansasii]